MLNDCLKEKDEIQEKNTNNENSETKSAPKKKKNKKKSKNKVGMMGHKNRGDECLRILEFNRAVPHYEAAIKSFDDQTQKNPDWEIELAKVYSNVSVCYAKQGRSGRVHIKQKIVKFFIWTLKN